MQHFTYKYWLTTQTKGGNFETSEKYKKKNPKPKPISNPKKEEAARPPFPRSEKTRESRGGRKPPFPCLQRPAAPPLWFSSSPQQPATNPQPPLFQNQTGAATPFPQATNLPSLTWKTSQTPNPSLPTDHTHIPPCQTPFPFLLFPRSVLPSQHRTAFPSSTATNQLPITLFIWPGSTQTLSLTCLSRPIGLL